MKTYTKRWDVESCCGLNMQGRQRNPTNHSFIGKGPTEERQAPEW
jgi:hypothetical protein